MGSFQFNESGRDRLTYNKFLLRDIPKYDVNEIFKFLCKRNYFLVVINIEQMNTIENCINS